jgi:Ca2+-binding EF-hand superfamily protein
MYVQ